jgi:ATP-dependent Clp protease, protease subunit
MKPQDQTHDDDGDQPNNQFNPFSEFEVETYKALLKDRTILFNGVVDKSAIERIVLPLGRLGCSAKPIKLLLNSPGGSVEDGQMVVDAILTCKAPVTTIALGQAMSAAFDIFLAGDRRVVYPNTILMMHAGSSRFENQTLPQINKEAELHKRYFERWSAWYASRTSIAKKDWLGMLDTGLNFYYFAEDAIKHGIAHETIGIVNKNVRRR